MKQIEISTPDDQIFINELNLTTNNTVVFLRKNLPFECKKLSTEMLDVLDKNGVNTTLGNDHGTI